MGLFFQQFKVVFAWSCMVPWPPLLLTSHSAGMQNAAPNMQCAFVLPMLSRLFFFTSGVQHFYPCLEQRQVYPCKLVLVQIKPGIFSAIIFLLFFFSFSHYFLNSFRSQNDCFFFPGFQLYGCPIAWYCPWSFVHFSLTLFSLFFRVNNFYCCAFKLTDSSAISSLLFFFVLFCFLAALCSLQNLSSLTRDWTWGPGSESAES